MKRTSFLVALVALVALAACNRDAPPAPQANAAPVVEPVVVVEKLLDATLGLPGELSPFDAIDVYPRAQGFVRRLPVDRGSVVRKGDLLAQLEAPELTSQRIEAESRVTADTSTAERLAAAQQQNAGAVAEHDLELARATARGADARVASLRTLESYLTLTAPFDGVVTERTTSLGALVGPQGRPLMHLETVAKLRLTVAVPEEETSGVRAGDALGFSVRAWPGRAFRGTIGRVAHAVDTRTRTMPVELDVDNTDGALAPGMYARVDWHVRRPEPTLFVPEPAVVQATDATFVVRVRDGKAERVTVRRGMVVAGLVEVFGELHRDDVVARRGSEELKSGTAVTVRAAAK